MCYPLESAAISDVSGTPPRPRPLGEVRRRLRFERYSLATERTDLQWMRRFVRAKAKRHPLVRS